jgi:hypothetical protein
MGFPHDDTEAESLVIDGDANVGKGPYPDEESNREES